MKRTKEQTGDFNMQKQKTYVVGFQGKNVKLYDENGTIIRNFVARAEVVNAQITTKNRNPIIAITTKDGKFELYRADGVLIRRG